MRYEDYTIFGIKFDIVLQYSVKTLKKIHMKKFIIISVLFLFFSACKKDKVVDPTPTTPTSMEDLVVAPNFDWKTTRDIQITVTGKVNSIIDVLTVDGVSYQKAFITANKPYIIKLSIPSYEKTVKLSYLGNIVSVELGNGTINYVFE